MGWIARLQLRTRVALIASFAVALAVVVVAGSAFALTRNQLLDQLDASLESRIGQFGPGSLLDVFAAGRGRFPGGPGEFDALYVQLVASTGEARSLPDELELPVTDLDVAIASRQAPATFRTVTVEGVRLRMYTAPASFDGRRGFSGNVDNLAVQVARSLGEVESSLSRLGWSLFFGGGLGVLAAAGIGLAVARSALRPIETLTDAAESVAATQDLAARIDVESDDEVGRLAVSFNRMLAALDESKLQQRRLVRDASHELRTPLTALRTNIEMLSRAETMDDQDRRRLMDDVVLEIEELSALVAELVDLATDSDVDELPTTVELAELAEDVADRYRRRTGRVITVEGEVAAVEARKGALDRAVSNLIDNAIKWSDGDLPVAVTVESVGDGVRLAVADAGPGISAADRPRIFERFFRSDEARTMPGSGLGLAIVDRVVSGHGGSTFVDESAEGGAVVGFVLPVERAGDQPEVSSSS